MAAADPFVLPKKKKNLQLGMFFHAPPMKGKKKHYQMRPNRPALRGGPEEIIIYDTYTQVNGKFE